MVYGVVQYDFNAERPDELEAKAGEAIIVIAQSNPEWFVAKPIGRLGGPGLIPVSFIEIKDTATGQPVTDPNEAVQRAGVPKVEEWKKMAADYKNSSISLGKFDAQQQMASDMGRMSVGAAGNPYSNQPSNGHVSSQSKHLKGIRPLTGTFTQTALPSKDVKQIRSTRTVLSTISATAATISCASLSFTAQILFR
jgi:bud emergence protein 1